MTGRNGKGVGKSQARWRESERWRSGGGERGCRNVPHARQKIFDAVITGRFRSVRERSASGFIVSTSATRVKRRRRETSEYARSAGLRGIKSRRAGTTNDRRRARSHVLSRSDRYPSTGAGRAGSALTQSPPPTPLRHNRRSPPCAKRCTLRYAKEVSYDIARATADRVGGSEIQSRPLPYVVRKFFRSPDLLVGISSLSSRVFPATFLPLRVFSPTA